MKIVHIVNNDKFIKPFIDFIEKYFDKDEHLFVFMYGFDDKDFSIPKADNILNINNQYLGKKNILKLSHILAPLMRDADKVILHSLFSDDLIFYLYLHQKYLKKCYWVMWGGDLYSYMSTKKTLKNAFARHRKFRVVKQMGGLITYIRKGDYELAQKWYGAEGKCYESFFYPSNKYEAYDIKPKKHTTINIQIGNSADFTNNHIDVFKKLEKYKDEDIKVIVPLSYGNHGAKEYLEEVINKGIEIFGDKFVPLTEYMPFEKYLELLAEIDIAVFNHKRQQAMGNITTLLGLGKKVYVRSGETPWKMFEELGIKVYDTSLELSIDPIEEDIKKENQKRVKEYFSEENLAKHWKEILGKINE